VQSWRDLQGGAKMGPQTHYHNSVKSFFFNFTGIFLGKFEVKWMFKIPPNLQYVAAIPCNFALVACFADIHVSQGR